MNFLKNFLVKKSNYGIYPYPDFKVGEFLSSSRLSGNTHILKFLRSQEQQYKNHLEFVKELKRIKKYPKLQIYGCSAVLKDLNYGWIILATGPRDEAQKLSQMFYTPEAESILKQKFNNDWSSITASATISDVSEQGYSVNLKPFVSFCTIYLNKKTFVVDVVIE